MAKKKKEKIIYYDDNSTISDMSNLPNAKKKDSNDSNMHRPPSTFKAKWDTYWSAVKMMFLPMCVVLAVICVLYLLLMLIAK